MKNIIYQMRPETPAMKSLLKILIIPLIKKIIPNLKGLHTINLKTPITEEK